MRDTMDLKKIANKLQKDYVIKRVANIDMPSFKEEPIIREHIVFKGRVQKIGFRGEKNKIDYLKQQMKSLKRAKIIHI
ncbi:MAG TPA: hypothetical protein DDX29_00030, partial [Clostridiales bacterium]|nr:hypothetical protein [Clostridiales bacterium]